MGNYANKDAGENVEDTDQRAYIPSRKTERSITAPNTMSTNNSAPRVDPVDLMLQNEDYEDVVPTVFRWENGGKNAYITGTFNNWERQIPMHRSGNDFSYIHNVKRGKHAYKFIVDEQWRFASDQPTVEDVEGQLSNFIDVSEFLPYIGDEKFFEKSKERKVADEEFHRNIPDLDEYTKEPPSLPPHLRHIILNKPSPSADPLGLPSPQHVSLNHLYCTAIKDNMMVLGVTKRYREKYITLVFYSAMPGAV